MRGMFGDFSSPNTSRRSDSRERSSHQKQQQYLEAPQTTQRLAASALDANSSVSSRRRQMAFMKYGSEKKVKKSSTSMNRMRERSRNISMQVSQDGGGSPSNASVQSIYSVNTHASQRTRTAFADFSTAFPGDDDDDDDDDDEGEDLFAPMHHSSARSRSHSGRSSAVNNHNNTGGFANFDAVPAATAAPPTSNTGGFANFNQDPFSSPAAPPSSSTVSGGGDGGAVQSSPGRRTVSNSNSTSRSGNRGMEQQQYQQRSVAQTPRQQHQQEAGFETDWPSESPRDRPSESPRNPKAATPRSMSTFPSNSSMRASFVEQGSASSYSEESRLESKLRQPVPMVTSPSFTSSASGAAARRRMRNQMRKGGNDASSVGSHQEPTPPQSPYSMSKQQRYQSGDSVGSGNNGRTAAPGSSSKTADHVQHYSVQQQQQQRKAMVISATSGGTRSIGSSSRSRGSSMESDPNMNLFDANMRPDAGMSFDAFGLDASQFDRDVNQAMQEIAGSHLNTSHFAEADPADDFAAGRWDSPGASRSSTPVQEEEGFVDGFRVTKQGSKTIMPLHARQSPTASTEKSSWTSESGSEQQLQQQSQQRLPATNNGRNQFKEQAGFHSSNKPPKVIRPTRVNEGRSPTRSNMSPQRPTSNGNSSTPVPRMPDLDDDGQPKQRQAPSSRQQQQYQRQNVDFVDVESDSERAASDFQASSEVATYSDVALASDVGVVNNFAVFDTDSGDVPMEVSSKKKKKNRSDDSTVDSRAGEEKKEDVGDPSPEKTVGSLRSRWEQGDAAFSQGKAQQQQVRQIPAPLRKDHIDNLQNQLGHEILSPEKLQQRNQFNEFRNVPEPQKERADECSEQRTSFASLKERLKSPTNRDESEYFTSKSEGGAAVRHSHANSVLNRFHAGSPVAESPRDAKSDAGGSPAFAAVQLRKTTFSKNDSPRRNSPAEGAGTNRALNDKRISPSQPSRLSQDDGFEQHNAEHEQREEPQPKKLNYRERRELELRKEREEEDRRLAEEKANEASQPDVASLIKRRIATNKKTPASPNKQPIIPAFREKLKPVETVSPAPDLKEARGQSSTGDMQLNTMPRNSEVRRLPRSPLASYQPRQADLVFEEAGASKKPVTQQNDISAPSSAISRMVMLDQLEQRQLKSEEHSMPPLSPVRDGNRMSDTFESKLPPSPARDGNRMAKALAIETAVSADSDEVHSRTTPKATTPKATMMMLNAFLSGRESISSADGAAVAKADQSETHHYDTGGTDTVEQSLAAATPAMCIPPAVKDDPKYERFFRMLKIGMPVDVVKHAMIREGVDPSVMDGDPNKPAGGPLKDNPTYKKYFKMLGFGLPMEAVKHAMERDGLDSAVMDNDHEMPINAPNQSQEQNEPVEKDSHRRARLHWKPLRKVTSNSLWAKIDQENDNIEIDEDEFQNLFQVEKNATVAPVGASATKSKRGSSVRVIDPKRANNGGIVLARLKMSHDDMADAVDRIDENALTAEQIENIVEYLPTKEERRSLESYMLEGGQDAAEKFEGLCECEKFMVSMMTVKHAKRKVRALLFKLQFESCLEDIHNDTVAIESACDELSDSTRLRQLFGFILTFGNRLNMAGSGGNVNTRKTGAFSLDSLLKLHQAKAFDKKTTFLHYLVLIVQRNNELLLNFKDDLPAVFKADKVFWDQCLTDLEEVENQLENVRKIALYQAHQARQARIYQVRRRKQRDDDGNESLSEGEASLTLEEEVEALRATPVGLFTLSAIKYVSSLRDRIETTKSKFFRLLEYFGEEDKKKQPHEIFSTIVAFSRDFDKEKEKVFAKQKSELREERKRQAKETKVQNGKPPTHSPAQAERPLRSSNMQPSMSSVLAEMKVRAPAVEPKPLLSPVTEVVAQESPTSDRYNESHAHQNNYSSNLSPKSPRSSSRYNDQPAQKSTYSNPAPENSMPSYQYSNAPPRGLGLSNRRNDESVQESSYWNVAARSPGPSNSCDVDSHATTQLRSADKELRTPNRTPPSGNALSQPMQAPYTTGRMSTETEMNRGEAPPSPIPATTPKSARTATAMRQKARLRRQRITQASPANSASSC